jgi:hypothetical protein
MGRLLTLLAGLIAISPACAQGKLDQVREEVNRSRDSDRRSSDNNDSSSTTCDEDTDSEVRDSFGEIFGMVALTPWTFPHAAIDPGFKVESRFTTYPYFNPDSGDIVLNRPEQHEIFYDTPATWYSVRASAEFGTDFDNLHRTGLRLFVDTDTRVGLKTDWDYYFERLPCGCWDSLWIGDVTATFRFVQHEAIQMHTGAGGRFLLDNGGNRAGFNLLYGFDAFPVQPLHVFGSVEGGTLGSATVWRLHGGAGVNWTHGELFLGYDYLRIGNATLQGPFVGVRLWF